MLLLIKGLAGEMTNYGDLQGQWEVVGFVG
jgi:hypothetical protein